MRLRAEISLAFDRRIVNIGLWSCRYSRESSRVVCRSHCNLCQTLAAQPSRDNQSFTIPATEAVSQGDWKYIEVPS